MSRWTSRARGAGLATRGESDVGHITPDRFDLTSSGRLAVRSAGAGVRTTRDESPRPARRAHEVLARAARLRARASEARDAGRAARRAARDAHDAAVAEVVDEQLETMPVTRLGETTDGRVRVNVVDDAGVRTVAAVLDAGASRLEAIPEVGPETATKIVAAARQVRRALSDSVRLRFDAERRPAAHAELLAALARWRDVDAGFEPVRDEVADLVHRLDGLTDAAVPASSRMRWVLSGRRRRDAARTALERLERLMGTDRTGELMGVCNAVLAPEPVPPGRIWDEYAGDAVTFNGLLIEVGGFEVDEEGAHGRLPRELVELIGRQDLNTPGLSVALRGYQAFGARFALAQGRAIIGDEMGLGKTIEALAAMCHLAAEGGTHFLVVSPARVLVNWDREIARRTALTHFRLHGPERGRATRLWGRRGGVAVTTYDSLDALDDPGIALDMLVVDEAHHVKNPDAQRTAAVREWVARAQRTLYLTGTPMENRVDEFRVLVGHLQPEVAGDVRSVDGIAGADAFRRAVAPVYLRRNRADVLDELPPRIEIEQWVTLEGDDLVAYREAVAAGSFMGMRRAACAPGTLTGSAKLARLVDIVEEAADRSCKVAVFSFFHDVLAGVERVLGRRVIGAVTGAVSPVERQRLIDRFTAVDGPAVLVSQIEAGGVGLNIQAASVVILTEPQWKPTSEEQAIARCHRLGQVRPVEVHRLLAQDSVDERMLEVLARKRHLFDEYVRRSELKDATPDAVDVSGVEAAREVAGQAEWERRIIEDERRRLGLGRSGRSAG